MSSPTTNRAGSLRLADGRRLSYVDAGLREGTPVFYCHGAIGTPLAGSLDLEALCARLGVRHIAISRPGIGGSDPAGRRPVLAFAADLESLADALGLEHFSVIGVSAGGPYALAAGRRLADRVERIAVCSSLSPLGPPHRTPGIAPRIRIGLATLATAPRVCGALGNALLPLVRRHPDLLHRVICAHAAPAERERLNCPAERLAAITSFLDATADGVSGMIEDYLTYCTGWGFRPEDVSQEVHVWHGGGDPLVPVEHALQLGVSLPRCRVFVDADEGHHFFRRRFGDILSVLLDRREPATTAQPAPARALVAR